MTKNQLDVSVVIPFVDRIDKVDELVGGYKDAMEKTGLSYEFVFVVDGGAVGVADELTALQQHDPAIRILLMSRYFGEATALNAGLEHATGRLLLTLPAYHQVEPDDFSKLFDEIGECDMVVTHRWPRRGSAFETTRRRVFHGLVRALSGAKYRDLGCGVRLLTAAAADEIHLYGDLHRFLPILASQQGFVVREIDVRQSPRDEFRGSYRFREYLHRLLDILTVFFLVRFTKKPLRFFGMLGSIAVGVGGMVVLVTVVQRLFFDVGLADRPALLLGALLLVLGVQSIALGLIGELIIFTHAGQLKEYKVAEILNERTDSNQKMA